MLDELFGHMLAALRFGASQACCQAVLDIAFQLQPHPQVLGTPALDFTYDADLELPTSATAWTLKT